MIVKISRQIRTGFGRKQQTQQNTIIFQQQI